MLDKLEQIYKRWEDVGEQITDPEVISDVRRYVKLNKEYKDLTPLIEAYKEYRSVINGIRSAKDVLENEKDEEFRAMAKTELAELTERQVQMEEDIRILMIPKDPEDSRNATVEIRGGTGGDEAAIFAGDLYRMYSRYCERKGWKTEVVDFTEGTMGGYKEIIFNIIADDAYGTMKYESGVHRVQRVPDTETQIGRAHV